MVARLRFARGVARRFVLGAATLGLVAGLAVACAGGSTTSGREAPLTCTTHLDCGNRGACIGGVCRKECEVDTHCPDPSYRCWGYRCVPRGDDATAPADDTTTATRCATRADCGPYEACLDGVCGVECYGDDECGAGARCVLYECVATGPDATVDAVTPSDVPRDVTAPADVPSPTDTNGGRDLPPPPPDVPPADVPPALLPYGSTCSRGSQCEGDLCLQNKMAGVATCTHACRDHTGCPAASYCAGTAATFDLRLPVDLCVASDAGTGCDSGCVTGLTLGPASGTPCICTHPCAAATQCVAGLACGPFRDAGGAPTRLCTPIGPTCDPLDATNFQCMSGFCYPIDDEGTRGRCTVTCTGDSHCPEGWLCYSEQLEDGSTFRSCQPR